MFGEAANKQYHHTHMSSLQQVAHRSFFSLATGASERKATGERDKLRRIIEEEDGMFSEGKVEHDSR
eukprot:565777-Hanusia_phi.AAC.1